MPPNRRIHTCLYCPSSYPTKSGLTRHLGLPGRCNKKTIKARQELINQILLRRTKRKKAHRSKKKRSRSPSTPGPISEPVKDRPPDVPSDFEIIEDEADEGGGDVQNVGAGVGDEAVGDVLGAEVRAEPDIHANVANEQEYLPYDPPPPPEPFDGAGHIEKHPSEAAGGVLRWVIHVERPSPYAVILEDQEIFEIAHWLANQPLTDAGRDAFLRMSRNQDLPWKNVREFNESIDAMPHGPGWYRRKIRVRGDRGELVADVWLRNSLQVVRQLLADPKFRPYMRFAPARHWTSALRQTRIYSEMWTGDWWWNIQNILRKGATVCPIILASDKTQLTQLSGGKQAWPVYLMIGNISKKLRRRPGEGASLLVGYLPADNLKTCISNPDARRLASWKLFHKAMELLMRPIQAVSRSGVEMECADGGVRRVHPILAAYMGDLPEQLLVTCTQQDRCPVCLVPDEEKDVVDSRYPRRDRSQTMDAIEDCKQNHRGTLKTLGIREITNPFWANLPYTDIFAAMAPDILHQLDKGIFGDYMVTWAKSIIGTGDFDCRLKGMPRFQGVRHFTRGTEPIPKSQWTGNEAKALGRVYLPTVVGTEYTGFTRAARAIVDFQARARLPELSDVDLADLTNDLRVFHANKKVFIESGARADRLGFDGITKLHMLVHYVEWVRRMGTLDGYNTEISERLHIDCVKKPWRATNHVDATEQMTTRLQRKESWVIACAYMYERNLLPKSLLADYESEGKTDYRPRNMGNAGDEDNDDVEVEGIVFGNSGAWAPGLLWHPSPSVYLAKAPRLKRKESTAAYLACVHGATKIVEATLDFLVSLSPNNRIVPLNADSEFRVWTRFRLHHDRLPFLPSLEPRIDRVRAFPARRDRHGDITREGYMDTVLFLSEPKRHGLQRYRAGRVRAIFKLPIHLEHIYDKPLVYLETFRAFTMSTSYPDHRLCTTRPCVSRGQRVSVVLPLSSVRAACHLAPQYHRLPEMDPPRPLTSSDDLLSMANSFYLSRHSSDFFFAMLDHWRRAGVEDE